MSQQEEPSGFAAVTVVLLTVEEFPGELADDYPAACAALDLPVTYDGYALLLGQDTIGARWTQVSTDTDAARSALALWDTGLQSGISTNPKRLLAYRPGWPIECHLALADRTDPHDPTGAETSLRPPQMTAWPGAERRRAADRLASDLEDLIVDDDTGFDEPHLRLHDILPRLADLDHPAVTQALSAAWRLATDSAPAPGSVRSRRAAPGPARLLRASADGWSLVGRTDNPVLLLTDQLPAIAADLTGTDRLAELLDALDAAATRAVIPSPPPASPRRRGQPGRTRSQT
ncbi:conserved hypothetical protein [Parafrankia sp. EAN1pec]|uniref:hypothetical protein n=1 Tax=Parafrankia sp. (strain EAN1pec) TaxID=298653 RepID=UPI0000541867|nr:conserved hypothetical protein [Frankia sp. EAN1pec]